mmetsp:Transcript_19894/g.42686  ORF Transcript_19894/g.42686 Transcript_19894/m.42686 type:complete len:174 (+) Transcript_19894:45-566(+)
MKTASINILFASAVCTFASDAAKTDANRRGDWTASQEVKGQTVSDFVRSDEENPYGYLDILRNAEEERAVMDKYFKDQHREELSVDDCDAHVQSLATCFDFVKEPNGVDCWDCVDTHSTFDSCEQFCTGVERCRSSTCQTGSACLKQYYEMMNCILFTCNCDAPQANLRVTLK